MKSRRRKNEGRPRKKPKRRLARWLAAPLLVAGLAFGGCSATSTSQSRRDTSSHEIGNSTAECVTWGSQKEVDNSTQYIEKTYCKGELEAEASHFEPPLEPTNNKKAVEVLGEERLLVHFDDHAISFAQETGRAMMEPGDALDIIGYRVQMGVPVGELDHTIKIIGIDGSNINIAILDTLYAPGESRGPDVVSAEHFGWFAFNVLPGEWVYLKIYNVNSVEQEKPFLDMAAITKPDTIFPSQSVGGFAFGYKLEGEDLAGWTLSRPE